MIGSYLLIEKYSYYKVNASFTEIGDPSQQDFTYLCGLTSNQMKAQNSYTNWNFSSIWDINGTNNDGYPFLRALPVPCNVEDDAWRPTDIDNDGYVNITNSCELHWVDEHTESWSWDLELDFTNGELDCDGKTSKWNSNLGFLPIGRWVPERNNWFLYKGNFKGNDNTIKNLSITNGSHAIGFLGCVSTDNQNNSQIIEGIILENLTIACPNPAASKICFVGGIVGHFWEGGNNGTFNLNKILNCKVKTSSITCNATQTDQYNPFLYIGGLLGGADNGATIQDCSVEETTVTGIGAIGGLAGYTKATSIYKCFTKFNSLSTTADSSIGGLIGICDAYTTESRKCYIDQCFTNNDIDVDAGTKIGGFIGSLAPFRALWEQSWLPGKTENSNTKYVGIKNCYSKGSITAPNSSYIGGFIGRVNKGCNGATQTKISQSYSASTISGRYNVGGFIGDLSSYTPDRDKCFWDYTLAPLNNGNNFNVEGKSTTDMQLQETFNNSNIYPDWSFGEGLQPPYNVPVWQIDPSLDDPKNEGYPFLFFLSDLQAKISIFNQNYIFGLRIDVAPNPIINISTLEINMLKEDSIDLSLYNISGNIISTIYSGKAFEGSNYFNFDASQLNSGTYYIVLRASKDMITKTVVINK